MTKSERKAKKLRKREENAFQLKLARIYGRDASDLSEEAKMIFRAAGDFHLIAFRIVDQAQTAEARASLTACAEAAIIKTFDLKKMKAHPQEHIPHSWNAEQSGVVPAALRSI
jgi:hypothetical protein